MTTTLDRTWRRLDLPPLTADWSHAPTAPRQTRQARRATARQAAKAKGAAAAPDGLTLAGAILAAELPTHETGEWRLRDGWVSERDSIAWHEAGHAVVALHLGGTVKALTLTGGVHGSGGCDWRLAWGRGADDGASGWRGAATMALAGAHVVTHICRDALGLADRIAAEGISDSDRSGIDTALAAMPEESDAHLREVCGVAATVIVLKHAAAFGALVRALLEHGSLDAEHVTRIWDATAAPRPPAVTPSEDDATLVVEGTFGAMSSPKQVARDSAGNLYVADFGTDKVQKWTAAGVFVSDIITGVDEVTGVCVDGSDNVYVTAKTAPTDWAIKKYDSAGTLQWTSATTSTAMKHLATNGTHVWFTGTVVGKRLCSDGSFVAGFGSVGSGDGQFSTPYGIAYNATTGNLYVVDQGNDRVQILTTGGSFVAKFGSSGSGDGQFTLPTGIAVSSTGAKIWVADGTLDRVQLFDGSGAFLAEFGSTGTGDGQFDTPDGIAVVSGDLSAWVVDSLNSRVQQIADSGGPYAPLATSTVMANTGKGWHPAWESSGPAGTPTKIVVADMDKTDGTTDYRAFWGVGEECWSFQCRLTTHSSRQAIQTGTGERFASTGSYLEWGPFNGGSIAIHKLASHAALLMEHASATDYVAYQYMTDHQHDETWITLGTATTDAGDEQPRTVLPFGLTADEGFSEGLSFHWIRQRLLWVGSSALSPAIVTALTLAYLPVPQDAATKAYTIPLPADRDPLTGKTAETIINQLEALLSPSLGEERFLFLQDGQRKYRAYISSLSYDTMPTPDGPGALSLRVIQIPTGAAGLVGES